ncbi:MULTISPECIES: hypothetical protein [Rhodopirellula]|uniref:hypothetical protein n=1 Tax=Rhodopirellula TaxID=265488 RepID=UPI00257FB3A7|nr:hypothetical protein [Rhodopirellula sp. UBA1907]
MDFYFIIIPEENAMSSENRQSVGELVRGIFSRRRLIKVWQDAAAKTLAQMALGLVTLCGALVLAYFWSQHTPEFLGKTWASDDGQLVLVCETLDDISLFGREEGPLLISLEAPQASESIHYEGVLRCADHGGVVGQVSFDLEPFNQIRIRTISNVQQGYRLDAVFRITWPDGAVTHGYTGVAAAAIHTTVSTRK